MAQDFYKRAQELHKEFQKRELHYLNAEKKWNSSISKKELSLPLQEYLQKINKREKEAEETYKNVMRQMEDLDKRTDWMSLKLEKLRIFRNNMRTVELLNWSSSTGGSNPAYEAASNFQGGGNLPLQKQILQAVSTQTENKIHCEKCNSDLLAFNHQKYFPEINNFCVSTDNLQSGIRNAYETTSALSELPFSSTPLSIGQNNLKTVQSTKCTDKSLICSNVDKAIPAKTNINELVAEPGLVYLNKNSSILPKEHPSFRKNSMLDDRSLASKVLTMENSTISEDVDITGLNSEPMSMLHEKAKIISIEENVELSKSDEGSMNHEFDFLESETPNVSTDVKSHVTVNTLNSSSSPSKVPGFNKGNKTLSTKLTVKEQVVDVSAISRLDVTVNKSDTSGSVTGPPSIPSENVSIASDSDSLPEKETSLKASAAYQALLGNTIIPPKCNKKPSDTDSEDEVEKALSNAVRKSSQVLPVSAAQPKDEKKSDPLLLETQSPVRTSKPTLVSKPQSKLSKNTRKVLGLDTSSGSEVELAVKPSGEKIDEDSDEFDFFD